MSEKKPSARPWSAVKRDAVASGAMAQERLEADKKRTIAEVRAHSLAEIRREQSTAQSELAKIMHVSQGRSRRSSPADWPIPNSERSVVTSRRSGVPYASSPTSVTAS